jgi:hypothetical protein
VNRHSEDSRGKVFRYVVAGIGVALLGVLLPFYLASGLLAPLWAIILLMLVWALLFALAIRWFRSYPYRVILLPVAAAAIWFATMSAGEAWLGWTG